MRPRPDRSWATETAPRRPIHMGVDRVVRPDGEILHLPVPPVSGMAWRDRAACAGHDPQWWFSDPRSRAAREAKRVCAACPVQRECLEYALAADVWAGVYGGRTPRQRREIARQRRREGVAA